MGGIFLVTFLTGFNVLLVLLVPFLLIPLIVLPISLVYFSLRQPDAIKADLAEGKKLILPLSIILFFSALYRSRAGLEQKAILAGVFILIVALWYAGKKGRIRFVSEKHPSPEGAARSS